MKIQNTGKFTVFILLLASGLFFVSGCQQSNNSNGNTQQATNLLAQNLTKPVLTAEEIEDILFIREEEKLARDVYHTLNLIYDDPVFQNITGSEENHMEAMANLIRFYNLKDPVENPAPGIFTNQELTKLFGELVERGRKSIKDAYLVGAYIEELDIKDLQEAIDVVSRNSKAKNIIDTYSNLMCGSRNHLRAFTNKIREMGENYTAQVLSQEEVEKIINSPQERCGRN